jgi:hypothetical protein
VSNAQQTGSASKIATAAAVVAAVATSLPALGVAGIHLGVLSPMLGFGFFTIGAVLGGLLALVLGLAGVFATRGGTDPDGRKRALTGLGGGVALLGIVVLAGLPGMGLPPINDITTNLEDPPAFEGDPSGRGRDMAYPADWKPLVRESYADLGPRRLDVPVAAAFDRALAAAHDLGWTVTRHDRAAGRIEATDSTAIFQFVDDVVIRIRPTPKGSVLDVRSKSRDGRGDVGANAARIRAFLDHL